MNKERILLHLNATITKHMTKLADGERSADTTLIVGNGTYNGIYFPTEELEKAFLSFQGVPINLDHSDDKVGDIVGYIDKPCMDGDKLMATSVLDPDTSKFKVANGYVRSRFNAGKIPNVSIGVWLDRVEEPLSKHSDDTRLVARNIGADHLGIVVHGACNPDDGCGIGINDMSDEKIVDWVFNDVALNDDEYDNIDVDLTTTMLKEEIKREKLKKQINDELNK